MNLSELETHLLHRLASATVTDSAVALAAELWEGDASPFTYDMVSYVLRLLNEQGLVVYVLGHAGVPVRIRVTDLGYTSRRPAPTRGSNRLSDPRLESRRRAM